MVHHRYELLRVGPVRCLGAEGTCNFFFLSGLSYDRLPPFLGYRTIRCLGNLVNICIYTRVAESSSLFSFLLLVNIEVHCRPQKSIAAPHTSAPDQPVVAVRTIRARLMRNRAVYSCSMHH